jgi:5-methylcytosine-specific restriction endonuclease McrA
MPNLFYEHKEKGICESCGIRPKRSAWHSAKYCFECLQDKYKDDNIKSKVKACNRRANEVNAPGTITLDEWLNLCSENGNQCLCCKEVLPIHELCPDHIVALSRGGSNYISNIQPLCGACNSVKHSKYADYRNTDTTATAPQ